MAIKKRFAAAAMSMCLATAVAGCSGDAPADKPRPATTQSAEPAEGPRITEDTYSYNAPAGWAESKQPPPGFDTDSFAREKKPGKDGFSDNVNVLRIDSPRGSLDDVEEQARKELEAVGIADLEIRDRASIDGADAIHLSASATWNKLEYVIEQFGVVHEDSLYYVTFSFTPDVKAAEREDLAASVLATWTWKD